MSGGSYPVTYVHDPPSAAIGITAVNGQFNYDGEIGLGVAATTISGTVEGPADVSVFLYPQETIPLDPTTGDAAGNVQIVQTATAVPIATGITAANGDEIYDWTAVLPTGSLTAGIYQVSAFSGDTLDLYPITDIPFYVDGHLNRIVAEQINAATVNLSVTPNTQGFVGAAFGLAVGDQTFGTAAGELSTDGRYLLYDNGTGSGSVEVDLQTGAQYAVSGTPTLGSFGSFGTIDPR